MDMQTAYADLTLAQKINSSMAFEHHAKLMEQLKQMGFSPNPVQIITADTTDTFGPSQSDTLPPSCFCEKTR